MRPKRDEGHEADIDRVQAFLTEVLDEAQANPGFAARLSGALARPTPGEDPSGTKSPGAPARRSHRRQPGPVDPFDLYDRGGEPLLRDELARYTTEQLKDIVAEHGMDRTKLAMKWRSTDRLIGLIVETVDARARKGEAFRPPVAPASASGSDGAEVPSGPSDGPRGD